MLAELCSWKRVDSSLLSNDLDRVEASLSNSRDSIEDMVANNLILTKENLRAEVESALSSTKTITFKLNCPPDYTDCLVRLKGRVTAKYHGSNEIVLWRGMIGRILIGDNSELFLCSIYPTEWLSATPALTDRGLNVCLTLSASRYNSEHQPSKFSLTVLDAWSTSVERAHIALGRLRQGSSGHLAAQEMLLPRTKPARGPATADTDTGADIPCPWWNANVFGLLDESQQRAVREAMSERLADRKGPRTIRSHCTWGPPGTGKSHTLVAMLLAFVARKDWTYMTAYTNVAVAQVAARVLQYINDLNGPGQHGEEAPWLQEVDCVVAGRFERIVVMPGLEVLHLDTRNDEIRAKWIVVAGFCAGESSDRHLAETAFAALERMIPRHRRQQLADIRANGRRSRYYAGFNNLCRSEEALADEIVTGAKLVMSTVSVAGRPQMRNALRRTEVVVIDEAAQVPRAMLAIVLTDNVVLYEQAGDHLQLAATVISPRASELKYAHSVFQDHMEDPLRFRSMLTVQRRSDPAIVEFYNRRFYDNRVTTALGPDQSDRNERVRAVLPPVTIFNFRSGEEEEGRGFKNRQQATAAAAIVAALNAREKIFLNTDRPLEVVVLVLYAGQIHLIEQKVRELNVDPAKLTVQVRTVDGFQGREADVTVLVTVRSNARGDIGYCNDERRFLVAVSRARFAVCLIIDASTFKGSDVWIKYCHHYRDKAECRVFDLGEQGAVVDASGSKSAPSPAPAPAPAPAPVEAPTPTADKWPLLADLVEEIDGIARKGARDPNKRRGGQHLKQKANRAPVGHAPRNKRPLSNVAGPPADDRQPPMRRSDSRDRPVIQQPADAHYGRYRADAGGTPQHARAADGYTGYSGCGGDGGGGHGYSNSGQTAWGGQYGSGNRFSSGGGYTGHGSGGHSYGWPHPPYLSTDYDQGPRSDFNSGQTAWGGQYGPGNRSNSGNNYYTRDGWR